MHHYAAIDIGSNAVRLLIKKLEDDGRTLRKTVLMRVPLRIGQDVFTLGAISDRKASDLTELIKAYAIVMKLYDIAPSRIKACATAAMREASNGEKVLKQIKKKTGVEISIISGEEEADLLCRGIGRGDSRTLVVVDVGGGSTEISIMDGGQVYERRSIAIGTVRILSETAQTDWEAMLADEAKAMAYDFERKAGRSLIGAVIIGAGGNIGKLYSMAQDRDATERTMSVHSLQMLHDEMANLTLQQRMDKYKMKPDRADVIVPAAKIFLVLAKALGISQIEIPAEGLADTIIQDIHERVSKRCRHETT